MEVFSSSLNPASLQLQTADESSHCPTFAAELEPNSGILIEEMELPVLVSDPSQPGEEQSSTHNRWKLFATTFVTIFLAELGDKTQVSTLLMSAEFHAPWVVFTGAAAALITTSLLGVLVGHWLSKHLSPKTLDTAAGITLGLISIWLLFDVIRG